MSVTLKRFGRVSYRPIGGGALNGPASSTSSRPLTVAFGALSHQPPVQWNCGSI